MGNTKSYRFTEETETYLERLTQLTGFTERGVVEAAIFKLFKEWDNLSDELVLDFHDNLFGINNRLVETFIESLPNAGYEVSYYGNGDRLVIKMIE